MSQLTVTQLHPRKLLTASQCVIGNLYRRESERNKLYVCVRDPRDTSKPLLASLRHGNCVTRNVETPDFVEVSLHVQVQDL